MADVRQMHREDAEPMTADGRNIAKLRKVQPEKVREASPDGPQPASDASARNPDETDSPPPPRPRRLRRVLLLLGPVLMIAAGVHLYLTGGRYVSTDNAYVRADKLNVATDVSGIVAEIPVSENQQVEKDQVLFRLDDMPYRTVLAGAEAQLGVVQSEIATLQANYRQSLAQIEQARTDIAFYQTSFERQQDLNRRGVSSQAALDQVKRDLDTARERVTVAERQAEAALAQLGGKADDEPRNYPRFKQVQASVDKAKRDLARTTVHSPMAGIVTNVNALQVGQYLQAAQAGFSLVATGHVWVEANPKETDLTYLQPGDPARVTIDTYPDREWTAKVVSVSPATGAEFSVLPAQNASGNWVKVVQRVAIRLELEVPHDAPPLRSGMSANVDVDTGHTRSLAGLVESVRHSVGL
jgi:membrane fusion protein, multidrug efflux system